MNGLLEAGRIGDQQALLSVLVTLVIVALVWRFDLLLERYTKLGSRTIDDLRGFRGVATATVGVVSLLWIAGQPASPWFAAVFERIGAPGAAAWVAGFLPQFLLENDVLILVTVLGAWWTWELHAQGDDLIERFVARRYDETLAPIVENVWDVTVLAVFLLVVLEQWEIDTAALLAPAGIIGIVLGFAARETVANFFGSLSLYADETYERGDYIELESGVSGTVRDISVRSTVLQTIDGDLVTVPNSELNEAKITNKSSPTTRRRIRTRIGVSYEADPDKVKAVLHEAAESVSETHEPRVLLREFGDSAMLFDVFVWIPTPEGRLEADDELNTAIYRALEDAGIGIPYPKREVAIADGEVRIE